MTTSGAVTEYAIPADDPFPGAITAGPDGNMWFTEPRISKVAKVTLSGHFTEYTIPDVPFPNSLPRDIVTGSDGNLWVTEELGHKVARLTPERRHITEYSVPSTERGPTHIAAGPDGNLWVTAGNKVLKLSTAGTYTEYPVSAIPPTYILDAVTAGPDGNMWLTANNEAVKIDGRPPVPGSKVVRMTMDGISTDYPAPDTDFGLQAIIRGLGRQPLGGRDAGQQSGSVYHLGHLHRIHLAHGCSLAKRRPGRAARPRSGARWQYLGYRGYQQTR